MIRLGIVVFFTLCTILRSEAGNFTHTCRIQQEKVIRQRLRNLHKGSDRENFPPLGKIAETDGVDFMFRLGFTGIADVDDEKSSVTVLCTIGLYYRVPELSWSNNEDCGLDVIIVSQEEIKEIGMWQPVMNNLEQIKRLQVRDRHIVLTPDGAVTHFIEGFSVRDFICKLDLLYFPMDIQACSMTWIGSGINLGTRGTACFKKGKFDSPVWKSVGCHSKTYLNNGFVVFLEYTILFERQPSYFLVAVVLPLTLLTCTSPTAFALPVNSPAKLGICVSLLLAFVMQLSLMGNITPVGSVTLLQRYCLAQLIANILTIGTAAIIQHTAIKNLERAKVLNFTALVVTIVWVLISVILVIVVLPALPKPDCKEQYCLWDGANYTHLQ